MTVLPCPDLDEAIRFFVERLGFRVDAIFPADAPREARISGHGTTIRLVSAAAELAHDADWHVGRAGMQYRDLLPGRADGGLVVSHIRVPNGGELPDYVHFHRIQFQLIYCYRGWVRVVYEDQGPPFVLESGDCVLQPPEIRHRVLECSPGLEVIEVGSPAEHETLADHELTLPTEDLRPERVFDRQRFVRHVAKDARWATRGHEGFEARDSGIGAATEQRFQVTVLRPRGATRLRLPVEAARLRLIVALRGSARLCCSTPHTGSLSAGSAHLVESETELDEFDDFECLEVSLPRIESGA